MATSRLNVARLSPVAFFVYIIIIARYRYYSKIYKFIPATPKGSGLGFVIVACMSPIKIWSPCIDVNAVAPFFFKGGL